MGNIQHKLSCFLDWIMIKEDSDKVGYGTNTALILSFGIISVISSIYILFFTFSATSHGLISMESLLRMILAGIFLLIGLGSLLFLRKSLSYNEKDEFWGTLKDLPTCLSAEEKLNALDTEQIKQLLGIGPEAEKEKT